MTDAPDSLTVTLNNLNWNSQYRFSVTAMNCFGKESETKLEGTFSTPADQIERIHHVF